MENKKTTCYDTFPDYVEVYKENTSNYMRVDVSEEKLVVTAYDEEQKMIDSCEVIK